MADCLKECGLLRMRNATRPVSSPDSSRPNEPGSLGSRLRASPEVRLNKRVRLCAVSGCLRTKRIRPRLIHSTAAVNATQSPTVQCCVLRNMKKACPQNRSTAHPLNLRVRTPTPLPKHNVEKAQTQATPQRGSLDESAASIRRVAEPTMSSGSRPRSRRTSQR